MTHPKQSTPKAGKKQAPPTPKTPKPAKRGTRRVARATPGAPGTVEQPAAVEHTVVGEGVSRATPISPAFCLTMIAKNELHVILRALSSALVAGVELFHVYDTGSDDRTPELCEAWMRCTAEGAAATGKPTPRLRVDRGPFGDFSSARNRALAAARAWLTELGRPLDQTWLVSLDADETVEGDLRPLLRTLASAGDSGAGSYLEHRAADLQWDLPKVFRADLPWHYRGVIHEVASCESGALALKPPRDVRVIGWFDSYRNRDSHLKYLKDAAVLNEALRGEHGLLTGQDADRAQYYLGQSYRCAAEAAPKEDCGTWYIAAIDAYQARVRRGGWAEESWHAAYMAARCWGDWWMRDPAYTLTREQFQRGVNGLWEAWVRRQHRPEPLYWILRYSDEANWRQLKDPVTVLSPWQYAAAERLLAEVRREGAGADLLFLERDAAG